MEKYLNKGKLNLLVLLAALGGILAIFQSGKLMLAACLLLIPILILILEPARCLYLAMAYSFIDFMLRSLGPIAFLAGIWDELLFIFVIAAVLVKCLYHGEFRYRITNLDIPIALFVSISLFLLLYNSPEIRIGIEGFRVIVQYIFWYFATVNVLKDKKQIKGLIMSLLVVVTLMALHGIYQFIIGVEMPSSWVDQAEVGVRTRVFSILTSPNILGSLMVLCAPICLGFAYGESGWLKKLVYMLCGSAMLLCLVFTFSRGAWISFALSIVIFGLLRDRRIIVVSAIAGILVFILVPSVANRLIYMLSPTYIASSTKGGRIGRWDKAIQIVQNYPLMGMGFGRFGGAVAARYRIAGTFYVDNFYLKTAVETGIIGLGSFITLLIAALRQGMRSIWMVQDRLLQDIGIGIFSGLVGVLAHNVVENVFEVPMLSTLFWILVAALVSMRYVTIPEQTKM
jgi:O-antigen ligase